MRKSILDCDVRRVPVILEHKVIRDDAMYRSIPLDVWVFLVVIYEERDAGSGESFGRAPNCEMGMLRHQFVSGDVRDPEALDRIRINAFCTLKYT